MRKYITTLAAVLMLTALCACQTTNPTVNQKLPSAASNKQVQQAEAQDMTFEELVAKYSDWSRNGKPIRQALIDLPGVIRVYAIDDRHTAVVFDYNTVTGFVKQEAWKNLLALATAYGGKLIEHSSRKDPITGKMRAISLPVKFWEENGRVMFQNPDKPNERPYPFDLNQTNLDWEGGALDVDEIIYRKPNRAYRVTAVIFSHPKSQPFVYKTPYLPEPSRITQLPPDGDIEKNEPVFAKHFNTAGKKLGFIFKAIVRREPTYTHREILQYITALCRNNGGKCQWVIPHYNTTTHTDTLTQVTPVEAWVYILTAHAFAANNHTWYMACDGTTKFAVKGQQHNTSNGGWYFNFYLYQNRTLAGLDFVPLSAEEQAPAEQAPPSLSILLSRFKANPIAEQIALQTARTKSPVTRTMGPTLYEGSYTGVTDNGCELVSVFRIADTSAPRGKRHPDIYNYMICNGKLTRLGITPPQRLSDTLKDSLPAIARKCQRYGQTKVTTSNYDVYCRALRGESQCKVEISVLKDQQLVRKFLFDGCTGRQLN